MAATGIRNAVFAALIPTTLMISACVSAPAPEPASVRSASSEQTSARSASQAYSQLINLMANLNIENRQAISDQLAVVLTLGRQSTNYNFWVADVAEHRSGVGPLSVDFRERTAGDELGNLLVVRLPESDFTYADVERLRPNLPVLSVPNHAPQQRWVFLFPGGRNEVRLGFSNSRPMYLRVISARRPTGS